MSNVLCKKMAYVLLFCFVLTSLLFTYLPKSIAHGEPIFNLIITKSASETSLTWTNVLNASCYMPMIMNKKGFTSPLSRFPLFDTKYILPSIDDGKIYIEALDRVGKIIKTTNAVTIQADDKPDFSLCKLVIEFQLNSNRYWVNGAMSPDIMLANCKVLAGGRSTILIRYVHNEVKKYANVEDLGWDAKEKKATVHAPNGKTIEYWAYKNTARVDGEIVPIDPTNKDVVPVIDNGRMLIPLRHASDYMGGTVYYSATQRKPTIAFFCSEPAKDCCTYDLKLIPPNNVSTSSKRDDTLPGNWELNSVPGDGVVLEYELTNTSKTQCIFEIRPVKNVTYVVPDTQIDLMPGETQNIQVFFIVHLAKPADKSMDIAFSVQGQYCDKPITHTEKVPIDVEFPPSCCDFKIEVVDPQALIPHCPGSELMLECNVTNLCKEEGHTFFFTPKSSELNVMPVDISVAPDSTEKVFLTLTLPSTLKTNKSKFTFVTNSDCEKEQETSFEIKYSQNGCGDSCDWELKQLTQLSASSYCAGEEFEVLYDVINKSSKSMVFAISMDNPECTPEPSTLDVPPGETKRLKLVCTMQTGVNPGDRALYTGAISSDCNLTNTISFEAFQKSSGCVGPNNGCCDYEAELDPSTIPNSAGLCAGDTGVLNYKLINKCTQAGSSISFNLSKGTGVDMIFPQDFTILAGETQDVTILYTMPSTGSTDPVDVSFDIQSDCGNKTISESVNYDSNCATTPPTPPNPPGPPGPLPPLPPSPPPMPCCDYTMSYSSSSFGISGVCAGSTATIKYKITNLCSQDSINFNIQGGIDVINVVPPTFSVSPGIDQEFEIEFNMPTNTSGFPVAGIIFSVTTDCETEIFGSIVPYCTTTPTCCTYTCTLDPSTPLNPLGYCPGDLIPLKYIVTNTCTTTDVINFNVTPGLNISSMTSASSFSVAPGTFDYIDVVAVMPANTSGATSTTIDFSIQTQCNTTVYTEPLAYDPACSPPPACCNYSVALSSLTPIPSTGFCQGDLISLIFDVTNNCTNPTDIIAFTGMLDPTTSSINPAIFTVAPADPPYPVLVDFVMPANTSGAASAVLSFRLSTPCGPQHTQNITVPYATGCTTCCAYMVYPPAPSVFSSTSLACGQETSFVYQFKNTCTSASLQVQIANNPGSNISGVVNDHFTALPGSTTYFSVSAKMPFGTPGGTIVPFTFDIVVAGCQTTTESFNLTAATCGTGLACTWNIISPTTPTAMCPGSSVTLTYQIQNTSASGFITFNLTEVTPTMPLTITPPSLTVDAGETKDFAVTYSMPTGIPLYWMMPVNFDISPTCTAPVTNVNYNVTCMPCSFTVLPKAGNPISMCSNTNGTFTYTVKNSCTSAPLSLTTDALGAYITNITPNTIVVPPGGETDFQVNFQMPSGIQDGSSVTYTFDLIPDCSGIPQTETFNIQCGCSWELVEPNTSNTSLNPGAGQSFTYTITNNCGNDLYFWLTPLDTSITGFSAPSPLLVTGNGGTVSFDVFFVMPACVSGTTASPSFELKPEIALAGSGNFCNTQTKGFSVLCDASITTCDWSIMVDTALTTIPATGLRLNPGEVFIVNYTIDVPTGCITPMTINLIPSSSSSQMEFVDPSSGLSVTSITVATPGTVALQQKITMPSSCQSNDEVEFYFTLKDVATGQIVPGGINAYCW